MNQTIFQERLKRAMFLKGIRKTDLAERVGIDRGKVSAYVSGRYKPNGETLTKIASALGVTADWLLGRDDTKILPAIEDDEAPKDETEMELIEQWRKADDQQRRLVAYVLKMRSIKEDP